jgi:hypothetical protein
MNSHSTQGRPWLKLADAKDHMQVELDGGFTCHKAGMTTLHQQGNRFYFRCNYGAHFIDDQADDGVHCVGIYADILSKD